MSQGGGRRCRPPPCSFLAHPPATHAVPVLPRIAGPSAALEALPCVKAGMHLPPGPAPRNRSSIYNSTYPPRLKRRACSSSLSFTTRTTVGPPLKSPAPGAASLANRARTMAAAHPSPSLSDESPIERPARSPGCCLSHLLGSLRHEPSPTCWPRSPQRPDVPGPEPRPPQAIPRACLIAS